MAQDLSTIPVPTIEEVPPPTPVELSKLARYLVSTLEQKALKRHEKTIKVNPFVSRVAALYEKLRNAMEYKEEEVILRAAIERILRRLILFGGSAKTIAEPLVRELVWARYLPDDMVPETIIEKVEGRIVLYLDLRARVQEKKEIAQTILDEWFYHLLSADIEKLVHPNKEEEFVANFMFQILKDSIMITDEPEETKDAQVYIAIRKAFAKDDLAFLRYQMFVLIFGRLQQDNVVDIAERFLHGYQEIDKQLHYSRKERIFAYIKYNTAPFLILEDIFRIHQGELTKLLADKETFTKEIFAMCETRYTGVSIKVRTAIIRSVMFILMTKVIFAFLVEGTYERLVYGEVLWMSIGLNTGIPPLLMMFIGFFMRTPGRENSEGISSYIQTILAEDNPRLGPPLVITTKKDSKSVLQTIFTILWFLAFLISFGTIVFILSKLQFNIVSQGIFIFFLTIVAFLSYRISLTADEYRLGERQGILTPFVDFLFMPIVQVGRKFTQGISQINILIMLFDLIIETPFKVIFGFSEQWFHFLHSKREELE